MAKAPAGARCRRVRRQRDGGCRGWGRYGPRGRRQRRRGPRDARSLAFPPGAARRGHGTCLLDPHPWTTRGRVVHGACSARRTEAAGAVRHPRPARERDRSDRPPDRARLGSAGSTHGRALRPDLRLRASQGVGALGGAAVDRHAASRVRARGRARPGRRPSLRAAGPRGGAPRPRRPRTAGDRGAAGRARALGRIPARRLRLRGFRPRPHPRTAQLATGRSGRPGASPARRWPGSRGATDRGGRDRRGPPS